MRIGDGENSFACIDTISITLSTCVTVFCVNKGLNLFL